MSKTIAVLIIHSTIVLCWMPISFMVLSLIMARERGEQMVQYRATRHVLNLFPGRMETEEKEGEMPESFWNSLQVADGWHYTETGRYAP